MRNRKNKKTVGIRRKVSLGFIIIAIILIFSSVISIFEYRRMSDYVSSLIADNINSINLARELSQLQSEFNSELLMQMTAMDSLSYPKIADDQFLENINQIRSSFNSQQEKEMADPVMYSYAAYMQVAREIEDIWPQGVEARKDWYVNRLQPMHILQSKYINQITELSQKALELNSQSLQDGFYRSIMPNVASAVAGLVLVFLFNIYLNFYLISPIVRMKKALSDYKDYKKEYKVSVVNDDEIAGLNELIHEVLESKK